MKAASAILSKIAPEYLKFDRFLQRIQIREY